MKTKILALTCALVMACGLLAGCGSSSGTEETTAAETVTQTQEETQTEETQTEETQTEEEETATDEAAAYGTVIRIGSLKGPTSIGLMQLMEASDNGESEGNYDFTITAAADDLTTSLVKGELDVILIPANAAATLYNKTEGGVTVLDINTLSVLYVVSADDAVSSIGDLSGRTVYLPGKGTTPDYALQYLLDGYGVTDCDLEYKSEATEVVAELTEDPGALGLIPQPYVTAACAQNEDLQIVIDIQEQWDALQEAQGTNNALVTGVTIVRTEFLDEHPEAVETFLSERAASAAYAVTDVAHTAELVEASGIVASAAIAEKAIPNCNIVCIDGEEMKDMLSGYLTVLYGQDPDMVGGALPEDDFYYIG